VSLEVRRADAEDAPSILNCLAVAFEMYRCQYSPQAYADTVLDSDTVRRRMAEMSVLVAVSEGRVVGTIAYCVRGNEGHVRGMAVLPRWQGARVASVLLETAEVELLAHGCVRVTLDSTQPLQRAIRFYERNGFSASGRVTESFGMQLYEFVKALSLV
jgi:GNAT superfamily N-acetyltransferase